MLVWLEKPEQFWKIIFPLHIEFPLNLFPLNNWVYKEIKVKCPSCLSDILYRRSIVIHSFKYRPQTRQICAKKKSAFSFFFVTLQKLWGGQRGSQGLGCRVRKGETRGWDEGWISSPWSIPPPLFVPPVSHGYAPPITHCTQQ